MLRVVLDVNVLASALVSPNGLPGKVVDAGLKQEFLIVRSRHIIETLIRTLETPYFRSRLDNEEIEGFLFRFILASVGLEQEVVVRGVAPDTEDDLALVTAVRADADFLVTGDRRFRDVGEYEGVQIVTAEEFLRELGSA